MRAIRCYDDHPFLVANGLRLEPIELSHDGGPTFGFRIEARPERREPPVGIGYLADAGCWSDGMAESLAGVDLIGLEFNHDVELQKSSPQARVSDRAKPGRWRASFERARRRHCCRPFSTVRIDGAPRHVVLLHLSEQCNQPDLALRRGPRRASSRGPRSAGSCRTAGAGLSQHPLERGPRPRAGLWSYRREHRRLPRVENSQHRRAARPPPAGLLRWDLDQDDVAAEIL